MLARFVYFMQQPVFRPFYALIWTSVSITLLLQSSTKPVLGPAAPPGDPSIDRELLLIVGHAVVFSGMTALWWWTFLTVLPHSRALNSAAIMGVLFGGITEILQLFVPSREPSFDDLGMNWLVTVATALMIQSWQNHTQA